MRKQFLFSVPLHFVSLANPHKRCTFNLIGGWGGAGLPVLLVSKEDFGCLVCSYLGLHRPDSDPLAAKSELITLRSQRTDPHSSSCPVQ